MFKPFAGRNTGVTLVLTGLFLSCADGVAIAVFLAIEGFQYFFNQVLVSPYFITCALLPLPFMLLGGVFLHKGIRKEIEERKISVRPE